MKVGDLLKNRRLEKGITIRGLALKSKVSNAYISQIETHILDSPPSDEKIIKLADALNMSEDEKQELLKLAALERTPDIIKKDLEKMGYNIRATLGTYANFAVCSDISNAEIVNSDITKVPVFSHVYAGEDGGCNYPEPIEYIELPIKKNGCEIIAIKVKGDSMEPRLYEGDLVVVKMEVEPNNKEAGVFITSDGDTVVKIYNVLADGRKVLTSLNPLYSPITDDFHIVGKVWKVLGGW